MCTHTKCYIFVKIHHWNLMEGTQKQIYDCLLKGGRGKIFFAQDFTTLGTSDSIRQALCALTDDRIIVRLARGVYCFPRVVGEYNIHIIYPSKDEIAEAIAQKSQIRIAPYGDQAAYLMGFTGLQIGRYTYLTDGAPRRIGQKGGDIIFLHTSEVRIFSFVNITMPLLSLAMRSVGKEGITPEIRECIRERLSKVPQKELEHDIKLCPVWVADLLMKL